MEEIFSAVGCSREVPEPIADNCENIVKGAKEIFKKITGTDSKISSTKKNEIKLAWIIRSAIEVGNKEITEEGQGHQRLMIASFLNACADHISEQDKQKKVLILFEEPELYLHPELKRKLNEILLNISKKENYQVIISTHDPYFLWANMGNDSVQTYSFERKGDSKTTIASEVGLGVEDEMLFISLYNKVLKKYENKLGKLDEYLKKTYTEEDKKMYRECEKDCGIGKCKKEKNELSIVTYVRHQIHHPNNNCNEKYSEKNFKDVIKILSKEI